MNMTWLKQKLRKKLKGWRTVIINIIMAIMPVLEMTEMLDILPDGWQSPYILLVTLVNLYLRSITTTPIGNKY